MVSLGLTVLVSLGIAGVLYNFHVFEKRTINKTEYQDYILGLQNYLNSTNGCNAVLVGKTLPATPTQIALNGYVGFGDTVVPAQGALVTPQLMIKSLTLTEKPAAGSGESVVRVSGTLSRKIGTISMVVDNTVVNQQHLETQKDFQVILLVDASNTIQNCMISKDMSGACQLLGGTLDPNTQTCTPNETCQFYGRYITSSCTSTDPAYPGTMGTYPCVGAASAPGQTPNNEFTGALSCPAGSDSFLMGETSQTNTFTVDCGKKCTSTVTQTYLEDYYMCLRCH